MVRGGSGELFPGLEMSRLRVALVSARFAHADGDSAPYNGRMILCPNCGGSGDAIESNLIDETPYREAARSAKMLRHLGAVHLATDLLTSLASVRIINFVRMKWRCSCGVTFDE
jgi:hypothetical protein